MPACRRDVGTLDAPADSADLGAHTSTEDDTRKRRKGLLIAKVGRRSVKPSPLPASAHSFEIGYPVYVLALLTFYSSSNP